MFSFYGGQQGKDFHIKKIFKNKVALQEDLNQRWQSPVVVGELVLISYGLPSGIHDKEEWVYDDNKQVDLDAYEKSYNSTLWQKIYTENSKDQKDELQGIEVFYISGDYGLGYKLLTSLTGETPKVHINEEIVLDADKSPYIEVDKNDSDYPELSFYLPQSQVIVEENVSTTVQNPGVEPSVDFNDEGENINRPIVNFNLPKAWDIQLGDVNIVNAGVTPGVAITQNEDTKSINFNIPQSQAIVSDNVTTTVQNPGVEPSVDFNNDGDNINRPIVNFNLPKAWGIELGTVQVLAADAEPSVNLRQDETTKFLDLGLPQGYTFKELVFEDSAPGTAPTARLEYDGTKDLTLYLTLPRTQKLNTDLVVNAVSPLIKPSVSISDDVDSPQLTFNLPEAVDFHYGDLLGKSADKVYTINNIVEGAVVGDYYINKATGFIYHITAIDESAQTTSFEFKASLSGAEPVVNTEFIDTFNDDNTPNAISIKTVYEDNIEKTGVQHTFSIPNPPDITATYNEVGALDQGGVERSLPDKNTINFAFDIPSGAKWYVGDQVNDTKLTAVVAGAENGDYYLYTVEDQDDIYRGNIYIYENGAWRSTGRNIEGPIGKSLNVVGSYEITSTPANDTVEYVGALLETSQYYGSIPNKDELIAVNYIENEDNTQKSYWYYYVNGKWNRTLLTGGFGGLIESSYIVDDENRVYSVKYINSLITNDINSTSQLNSFSAQATNTLIEESKTASIEASNTYTDGLIKDTYDTNKGNIYDVTYVNELIGQTVAEADKNRKTYNAAYLDSKFEEIGTDISDRVSDVENQLTQIKEEVLTDVDTRLQQTEEEIESLSTSVVEDFQTVDQNMQELDNDITANAKEIEALKDLVTWGKISELI